MNDHGKVIDIVAQIYESVAYQDVRQVLLQQIAMLLDAAHGCIVIQDHYTQQVSMVSSHLPISAIELYCEDIAPSDARLQGLAALPVGSIRSLEELVEREAWQHSVLHERFLQPHNLRYSLCACFYRDSVYSAYVSFERNQIAEDFDNQAKKSLGVFIPHLTRAFTISIQTKLAQLQQQIQGQIRRISDTALFLAIDKNLTRPMNEKAEQLLAGNKIFHAPGERLTLKNSGANKRLQHLIQQCISTAQGEQHFPGGFIRLEATEPQAPEWHIGVTPYRSAIPGQAFWNARGALIIVRAVERENYLRLYAILSDFYGLTAAETEVLIKLISGLSSSQIAEELALSKECVRSRLKKIYQKTGVSNQVELTHNILEGPYRLAKMLG